MEFCPGLMGSKTIPTRSRFAPIMEHSGPGSEFLPRGGARASHENQSQTQGLQRNCECVDLVHKWVRLQCHSVDSVAVCVCVSINMAPVAVDPAARVECRRTESRPFRLKRGTNWEAWNDRWGYIIEGNSFTTTGPSSVSPAGEIRTTNAAMSGRMMEKRTED